MLSGEGNDGERGLISKKKKNFARAAHFFCHFFAVVLHDYNAKLREFFFFFMEKTSYAFSFTFFHCRSFSPCIGGRQHFSFCHGRYKIFMLFFQQKNVSFVFYLSLQISVALFLVEFRWPAAYSLFFSVFLLLYIPNLWTWQLI